MDEKDPTPSPENRLRDTTEKLWEKTRGALNTAASRAGQYRRIVQKKIDLGAVHRRIQAAHGDLGQLVDRLRHDPPADLLAAPDVIALFERIDSLKQQAEKLEEELAELKAHDGDADTQH